MKKKVKTLFVVAGELSGDMFGSQVIKNLKKYRKDIKIVGLGGYHMENNGCEILYHTSNLGIMGFSGVLKKYFFFRNLFGRTLVWINKYKPDAVLFIDYSGFNLQLAPFVKRMKIQTFYYIAPKIWAWNRGRLNKIKKYIDKVFVIFDFEEKFYKDHGYQNVVFCGHPLLDNKNYHNGTPKPYPSGKKKIMLLPGSRIEEIEKHLPIMLKMTNLLPSDYDYQVVVGTDLAFHHVNNILKKYKMDFKVHRNMNQSFKEICLAIVASGTVTLECALMGLPLIVIYKTSFVTGLFARMILKIKHISLINILQNKELVPELVQKKCNPKLLAHRVSSLLNSPYLYEKMSKEILTVTKKMGTAGCSSAVAKAILDDL